MNGHQAGAWFIFLIFGVSAGIAYALGLSDVFGLLGWTSAFSLGISSGILLSGRLKNAYVRVVDG